MPSGGFIAVRRGLLEHLRRGKLTELEALTFIIILGLANPHTGIWWGSAKSLWGEYPFYGNERRARRALEGLASKRYIKRLSTPGKHSNYPILIDKYEVKVGEKVGLRLNARKSRNERRLCYEKISTWQGEGELGVIPVGEQLVKVGVFGQMQTDEKRRASGREEELNPDLSSSSQHPKKEKENENKKKRKNTAQASPSLDFERFWKAYPRKVGKPAALRAWRNLLGIAWDTKTPGLFMAGLERWKATEQWQDEKFIPYPATFLNQRRWEDEPPGPVPLRELSAVPPQTGHCSDCGAGTPAGFLKCLKCLKAKPPVNP